MIKVIDSHTGGEPTRVVVSGFPDLGNGTMEEQAASVPARLRRTAFGDRS
jgi:proline racemase